MSKACLGSGSGEMPRPLIFTQREVPQKQAPGSGSSLLTANYVHALASVPHPLTKGKRLHTPTCSTWK